MWNKEKNVRVLGKRKTIRSYSRPNIAESFDVYAHLSCGCAEKVMAYQEHQYTLNAISKIEEVAKTNLLSSSSFFTKQQSTVTTYTYIHTLTIFAFILSSCRLMLLSRCSLSVWTIASTVAEGDMNHSKRSVWSIILNLLSYLKNKIKEEF